MFISVIIVGGGAGTRFGRQNKLFAEINGIPVFIHSIRNFIGSCNQMIMAVPQAMIDDFSRTAEQFIPENHIIFTPGGMTRYGSVTNALKLVDPKADFIAVHDAARPLASAKLMRNMIQHIGDCSGIIPGKKVTDTIKEIDQNKIITGTPARARLMAVETPQIFKAKELIHAYNTNPEDSGFTDDASVMEAAGFKIICFDNPDPNIKITFPEDIERAGKFMP